MRRLKTLLSKIDGKSYGFYKDLRGTYEFGTFSLKVEKVQADPFAPPSRITLLVPKDEAKFPRWTYETLSRKRGLENYLAHLLKQTAKNLSRRRGSGKSGLIEARAPGQEMMPISSVSVDSYGNIKARIFLGLPASGRRILSSEAYELFFEAIPKLVSRCLFFKSVNEAELRSFVELYEDADFLRERLPALGLVAFVAEGSILPRASGVDPRPAKDAVPFKPPSSLSVEVELPNRGKVLGMGIPEGITLIVGGGFHGKSTLLRALELGVYNHRPGDGRELVISRYETVKVRAEDGRFITGVDISPFISALPLGKSTEDFETPCASGSTSQAAAIMEALELGAKVLLIDEDTSATNFMIRDARMQELIAKEKEPITPFLDRVRELYERFGVSSVIVMGGSGDYLEVADTVIAMEEFVPKDVTQRAKEVVAKIPSRRKREVPEVFRKVAKRRVLYDGLEDGAKVKPSEKTLVIGKQVVDLSAVEQLVNVDQVRTIGYAILEVRRRYLSGVPLADAVGEVEERMLKEGPCVFGERGDLCFVRRFEIASAINRMRSLKAKPTK